jgi:hypothetical protein
VFAENLIESEKPARTGAMPHIRVSDAEPLFGDRDAFLQRDVVSSCEMRATHNGVNITRECRTNVLESVDQSCVATAKKGD